VPSSCFYPDDLIVPSFDTTAKTVHLAFHIHPGQHRILEYLAKSDALPFRDIDDVGRWCLCWGLHCLLGPLPSTFALVEAKMEILQDERLEEQRDCITVSVEKYITRGNRDAARRLVTISSEHYLRIPIDYWRKRWLASLNPAIDILAKHGIFIRQSPDSPDH